jgi:hypothetical protein
MYTYPRCRADQYRLYSKADRFRQLQLASDTAGRPTSPAIKGNRMALASHTGISFYPVFHPVARRLGKHR